MLVFPVDSIPRVRGVVFYLQLSRTNMQYVCDWLQLFEDRRNNKGTMTCCITELKLDVSQVVSLHQTSNPTSIFLLFISCPSMVCRGWTRHHEHLCCVMDSKTICLETISFIYLAVSDVLVRLSRRLYGHSRCIPLGLNFHYIAGSLCYFLTPSLPCVVAELTKFRQSTD